MCASIAHKTNPSASQARPSIGHEDIAGIGAHGQVMQQMPKLSLCRVVSITAALLFSPESSRSQGRVSCGLSGVICMLQQALPALPTVPCALQGPSLARPVRVVY